MGGTVQDITERKQSENDLIKAKEHADEETKKLIDDAL